MKMEFQPILEDLIKLSNTSSTNAKKDMLASMMKCKNFRTVLELALDSRKHFNIKELPKPKTGIFAKKADISIQDVFDFLEELAKTPGTSQAEKQQLANWANQFVGGYEVVCRIVKKDLRCGVKGKLVNAVAEKYFPDFSIFEWPYMRCRSYTEKNLKNIRYPAYAQLKANGSHIDVIKDSDGNITFHSRAGNEYDFLGLLDKATEELFGAVDGVFIGEALVVDDFGEPLDRKTGNGIITKALKGTITKAEVKRIRIQLWEYVSYGYFFAQTEDKLVYRDSFENVLAHTKGNPIYSPIEHRIVNNFEEVMVYYKEVKERKLEGLVLKNFSGVFESTQTGSKNQMKVKSVLGEEYEAEFTITGFEFGEKGTRFENGLGALHYTSKCGKIQGKVGSGFSHAERDNLTEEDVVGKIATLRFDELIKDKHADSVFRLYAPRFIEFRRDKEEADSLEYVMEMAQ